MESKAETCAVVVTYNRKEKLEKCLECILNQQGVISDIVVVDNASTDGTKEMITDKFSCEGIYYYNTGSNLGGAGGFEFGVREAVLKGYKYIWIMDDDTWPEKDTLKELFRADKELRGDWGFLSSVAYWTDGSICRMNIQKRNIFKHVSSKEYGMRYAQIKMCSFVSLLVKSEIVKEIGLPIGEYFIWTDDYEFTGRISGKYPCYMVPASRVVHAMDKHTRVNFATDSRDRIDRYRYIYRNDVHCYRRYGVTGWLYILLKDLYTVLNIMIHSHDSRIKKITVLIKGFREGLSFEPEVKMPDAMLLDRN